jgi:hypothetical protein
MWFLRIFWNFNSLVSVKRAGGTLSKLKLKGGMWKVNFSLKADVAENRQTTALENFEMAHCWKRL